jgi:predicted XRE-type DNA-binding protein
MTEAAIEKGSDNVFADLGLPEPAERQTKTRLALALNRLFKERGLKQVETARLLGIPQPKVSALVHYRLDGFSVERLMEFLTLLGRDVEIIVRPGTAATGHLRVLDAV